MKSGLRDRNNTHKEIPYGFSCCSVSMKSGLSDRNNRTSKPASMSEYTASLNGVRS